jgi:hypothetical protein
MTKKIISMHQFSSLEGLIKSLQGATKIVETLGGTSSQMTIDGILTIGDGILTMFQRENDNGSTEYVLTMRTVKELSEDLNVKLEEPSSVV